METMFIIVNVMAKMAVVCKVITVDQFKTITGDDYTAYFGRR